MIRAVDWVARVSAGFGALLWLVMCGQMVGWFFSLSSWPVLEERTIFCAFLMTAAAMLRFCLTGRLL